MSGLNAYKIAYFLPSSYISKV